MTCFPKVSLKRTAGVRRTKFKASKIEGMIRLLATDIDGTLLSPDRGVSKGVKEALARAQAEGVIVVLASGRYVTTLKMVAEMAGVTGPIITCNGAYVEDAEGQVVMDVCLDPKSQSQILDFAEDRGIHANVYQPRTVITNQAGAMYDLYRSRIKIEFEISDVPAMKLRRATKMIYVDHPERVREYHEHFAPLAEGLNIDLTLSEPEYLEFLPRGANKGTALEALATHLGIPRTQVAAIGDYLNDLEMVQWAGVGAAVGNGIQALKDAADIVLPSNEEDGLAHFIDHILELRQTAPL